MRYGIIISPGNVHELVGLACEAEARGWDGVFVADAIGVEAKGFPASPWSAPWVALAGSPSLIVPTAAADSHVARFIMSSTPVGDSILCRLDRLCLCEEPVNFMKNQP